LGVKLKRAAVARFVSASRQRCFIVEFPVNAYNKPDCPVNRSPNYLPSMFIFLAMVALVFRYVKPTWLEIVCLCVVGTLFAVWIYERNKVWRDELSLYRDCVEKSPAKAQPHNNFGAILCGNRKSDSGSGRQALRLVDILFKQEYRMRRLPLCLHLHFPPKSFHHEVRRGF
jgi:hypothetical protein